MVVTLEPGDVYPSLCNRIDDYLGGSYSKRKDPHISLLYSRLSCDEIILKERYARPRIPEDVEIYEIAVVALQGQPDAWKILQRNNFYDLQ